MKYKEKVKNKKIGLVKILLCKNKRVDEQHYLQVMWLRKCIVCENILPLNLFAKRKNRWKEIYRWDCIPCKRIRYQNHYKDKYNNDEVWRKNMLERNYKWCRENKEKVNLYSSSARHRRRWQKKLTSDYTITRKNIRNMLDNQKWLCVKCGCDIRKTYTLDHCKPLSKWWEHTIKNIQLMCRTCNCSKWSNSYRMEEWKIISIKNA